VKRCWAHATEPDVDAALTQLAADGRLDGRGVRFTEDLLLRVLGAVPRDEVGALRFHKVWLDRAVLGAPVYFVGARFLGDADFDEATFTGDVAFDGAELHQRVSFAGARFAAEASFYAAGFTGSARFADARFTGEATFADVVFARDADFDRCRFDGEVSFSGAAFGRDLHLVDAGFDAEATFRQARVAGATALSGATFAREADFGAATFGGPVRMFDTAFEGSGDSAAWFGDARFEGGATFSDVRFAADAVFANAVFLGPAELGPLLVEGTLLLGRAVFAEGVQLEVAAGDVSASDARLRGGGRLRLLTRELMLAGADLAAPTIVVGAGPLGLMGSERFDRAEQEWERVHWRPGWSLRLLSLEGADVAGLLLSGVDLGECRFAGAHNLDRLRVESPAAFPRTPGWRIARGWPPAWRWTSRRTLAEEHAWRAAREQGARRLGWEPDPAPGPEPVPVPAPWRWRDRPRWWVQRAGRRIGQLRRDRTVRRNLAPERRQAAREIATLYRALRKGREDQKDEPGSADFYYGEMEMRRAASGFGVERLILGLYWLISGYALRASRALVTVLAALVVAALLFMAAGFDVQPPPAAPAAAVAGPDFADALLFSARTALGLGSDPPPRLTTWGGVIQIAVRVTVPVLLGLAVLSIRGRVKR
jgi:hypothetical protein